MKKTAVAMSFLLIIVLSGIAHSAPNPVGGINLTAPIKPYYVVYRTTANDDNHYTFRFYNASCEYPSSSCSGYIVCPMSGAWSSSPGTEALWIVWRSTTQHLNIDKFSWDSWDEDWYDMDDDSVMWGPSSSGRYTLISIPGPLGYTSNNISDWPLYRLEYDIIRRPFNSPYFQYIPVSTELRAGTPQECN